MAAVQRCRVPDHALLGRYERPSDGGVSSYVDCYAATIEQSCSLADFVFAFYTTPLFRLERFILARLAGKPSTDVDARCLADGKSDGFAAWTVEERATDELLLCDFHQRTRSWLKVTAREEHTLLMFGSAVVPRRDPATGKHRMGAVFKLLLPFHKLYSRALLRSAITRLQSAPRGMR